MSSDNASSTTPGVSHEHRGFVECAFDELFRAHHSLLVTAAFNRLSNLEDAEEAVAEVYVAAWRHRDNHVVTFTLPWLYATLRNIVGNEYRRRNRAGRREIRLITEPFPQVAAPQFDDDAATVRRIISGMRPGDRELLWMAYWEELTGDEMAAILGCSRSAVKVRLLRARGRLRVLLAAHDRIEYESERVGP